MSSKVRCIGGSHDGDLVDTKGMSYVEFYIKQEMPLNWLDNTDPQAVVARAIPRETYRLEKIQGKNKTFYLLVISTLDIDDALDRLINLY